MHLKHSGLGIASSVVSIIGSIGLLFFIIIAGVVESSTPEGMDEESVGAILIGLFVFAFLGVSFVALGLGVAGLLQKDRNKTFAIIGIAISAVAFLGTLFLLIVGLAMG